MIVFSVCVCVRHYKLDSDNGGPLNHLSGSLTNGNNTRHFTSNQSESMSMAFQTH